jgi:hypothetical protein
VAALPGDTHVGTAAAAAAAPRSIMDVKPESAAARGVLATGVDEPAPEQLLAELESQLAALRATVDEQRITMADQAASLVQQEAERGRLLNELHTKLGAAAPPKDSHGRYRRVKSVTVRSGGLTERVVALRPRPRPTPAGAPSDSPHSLAGPVLELPTHGRLDAQLATQRVAIERQHAAISEQAAALAGQAEDNTVLSQLLREELGDAEEYDVDDVALVRGGVVDLSTGSITHTHRVTGQVITLRAPDPDGAAVERDSLLEGNSPTQFSRRKSIDCYY